jgi:NAD(P)-dependent dehydrogenase (short-subunit alcohol dehydrogenase family)
MRSVAEQVNSLGRFDAVIQNVAVLYREPRRNETADGLAHLFAINKLVPYVLTALIKKPKRLVYISSGMHQQGDASLQDLQWENGRWNGSSAYTDSKLYDVLLAFGLARKWPEVFSNSLEPGWVPQRWAGRAPRTIWMQLIARRLGSR